ncbi:MAG: hypothetical protein PHD15_03335 [Clostridia bacterium]|nr:hypothetical protein [Clostridia bacterium]MDD4386775.1 hypothetical protein [Clostridia bacterium]
MQNILKKSDKSFGDNFQEMLNKSIKPLSEDKIKKDFEPKIKKVDDQVKRGEISRQIKSGADVDKIANDLDQEKDENTSNENLDKALTTREETLKYMYSVALDEYYFLRQDLYKHQIQDGNIALDDRNYLKLLQYENYIRKCDTVFKQNNGSYISSQDEDISKKENKYAYDAAKSETKVVNQHEDSINEIDRLNAEIESKANEIIQINEAVKDGTVTNYEEQIELLEKQYIVLNGKMHMLKPDILELYRQEDKKKQQEKTTTRVVGTMYEKRKNNLVIDTDVVRLDRKTEKKHDSLGNAVESEKNELQNTNIDLANSYIDAAETALEKKDVGEALFMVNKAKELVGNKQVETITSDKNLDFSEVLKSNISSENGEEIQQNVISETEIIDIHLNDVLNESIELSNLQKECAKAVYTPEERGKNALAREANKGLEKVKEQDITR